MIKECIICKQQFETHKMGNKRKYCFECSPSYTKGSTSITFIRRAIKKQLVLYKGGKCEKCGYNKCIEALQFHHLDSQEKDFEISDYKYITIKPIEDYYKEVDKCKLLCSNCHIEEHHK